ncbi:GIY-YIG nuclease family protein [Sphingomonas beigongshangi]|uniref:GIY-YIG nuclease family protein n=1 Tax=Sphingomonas beigongshangi TaxID=2782540 RepID=UPI00193C8275|nr:GIY-YIG nuclease family protein [Sphingomonas beigongshangi]
MADTHLLDKAALAKAHLLRCMADKRPRPRKLVQGYVYFCGPIDGPIKIGFSKDPRERLYRLQTNRHDRLHLWAETPGTDVDEASYHNRFFRFSIGGEWFARTPEIEAEIARLNAGSA